jgi:hypothetical protein
LRGGKVPKPNARRYDREILLLTLPALGELAAEPTYVLVDMAVAGPSPVPRRCALAC